MSEKYTRNEASSGKERFLDAAERYNKLTAALGAVATATSAVVLNSPELTVFFGVATAADIATGGLIKRFRNRKSQAPSAASG